MGLSSLVICDGDWSRSLSHVKTLLQSLMLSSNSLNLSMNKSQKVILIVVLSLLIVLGLDTESIAQCPMCRMSAESNLKDGGTAGKGLNKGILYMLTMPYLLVFGLGFLWWRNRRRLSDEIYDQPVSDN